MCNQIRRMWMVLLLAVGLALAGCGDEEQSADNGGKTPAARDGLQPTSWNAAKVGDVIKYRVNGSAIETVEVTEVTDEDVKVQVKTEAPGIPESATRTISHPRYSRTEMTYAGQGEDGKVIATDTQQLNVGDKSLTCSVQTTAAGDGSKKEVWTSDQVPGGVVKSSLVVEGREQESKELIEFKRSE